MITWLTLTFLHALIDPVFLGGTQYINKDPLIGASANTGSAAKQIMQKLITTRSVQLDAYNSVFASSDLFKGFLIHTAKIRDGHTIFNFSSTTETNPGYFRFILNFAWEKTKSYTQEFIEITRQVIIKAFSVLQKAPEYFSRPVIPEKPKAIFITELKDQNPDKPLSVKQTSTDPIAPIHIGTNQYINRNPVIGACATSGEAAKQIMQKLIDTQHVLLDAYHSVFMRSDVFSGLIIHAAKVHKGHTIFTYSQVGDRTGTQYRFILGSVWERTKSYTQDFIEATRQVITTAFSALKEAPGYFSKTPALAKSTTEAIDQFSTHLDQVWQEHSTVRSWSADQIKSWKERFAQQPTGRRNIHQMVAVLMRAAELSHGHVPRNTQLVSVLACLFQSGRGRFLQVKTGEGKSLITAMLAASKHLLEDIPVDVLSSSEILAERDATAQQKFYSLLSIRAGFKKKTKGKPDDGVEEFYRTHQIIYSDISELVFDDLKQSYQGTPTRGNRPFAALIIDEVDSLLVDRVSMICKLSTDLDCSESLLPFMQLLWLKLEELEKTIVPMGDGFQNVLSKEYFANGSIKFFYITRELEAFCLEMLDGKKEHIQLPMPRFLRDFARLQIPRWVQSVQRAKAMTEGKDYVYLENDDPDELGEIKIVDFEHTGVVQANMQWSDGLHQFLGVKHAGCIYPESLTSCFLSTLGFLSKYKNNIFGLTGTLGDSATRKFIEEVYGVSLLDIPTYKPKQFKEVPGVVCEEQSAWKAEVIKSVEAEIQKGRAVLVISETIRDCEAFKAALRSACPHARMYHRNDRKGSEQAVADIVQPGDVILATNLGGRGTDVGTSPMVELNGGLHVIVTFLPMNQRVEDQAFGRTSRQGKLGTAQLIVDKERTIESLSPFIAETDNIEGLRTMRQQKEEARIGHIRQHSIAQSELNDRLFDKVNAYVKRLLNNTPLHKHEEYEKIKQADQLWALQFHRLSHYKENLYRKWNKELMNQLQQFELAPGRGFSYSTNTSVDALYDLIPFPGGTHALRGYVLSYLLNQKQTWTDSELERFCHDFVDTRQAPDALFEVLCHLTQCTYVRISHSGYTKIFRSQNPNAHIIYVGHVAAYPVSQTGSPLNVLSQLYYPGTSKQPSLDTAQLPSNVCRAYHPEGKIHPTLEQRIQATPPLTSKTLSTPAALLMFFITPPHPLIERVLSRMAQNQQTISKQLWQKEEAFAHTVVQGFITDLSSLYAKDNDILIAPASLSKRAKRSEQPETASRLFERAIASDSLYSAVACYDWASYVIRHPSADYKKVAEEKLTRCIEELKKMVLMWQYIAVFSEDSSGHNPIAQQVRGRMEFYGHMLSNIQANLDTIGHSQPSDSIRISTEDSMEELMERMVHLKHKDALQLMNHGIHGLDVYSAISPEPSIWESIMVSLLGVAQTVVGCLLTVSGIPLGASIVVSGLQDLWRAGQALVTGKFSWESYWFDKGLEALTIGISHVYSTIKNNISAAHQAVTMAAQQTAQSTQKLVMDTLIRGAKEVLVKNVIAELGMQAVKVVVFNFRGEMETAVQKKVTHLLEDQRLREHLCHLDILYDLLVKEEFKEAVHYVVHTKVQKRMAASASQTYQIIQRLTRACAAQDLSGSSVMGIIAKVSTGVNLAHYMHEAMTCVDTYIQYLREETISASQNEKLDLVEIYEKNTPLSSAARPYLARFTQSLAQNNILVGTRPYLPQRAVNAPGFNASKTIEQIKQEISQTVFALPLTQNDREILFGTTLTILEHLRGFAKTPAELVARFTKEFIQLGTDVLFGKTVAITNEVVQHGASAVKGMLSKFRTSTQKILQDHEQQQERIAQEKVLEQKRIEQAKVAAAQQKVRQKVAADSACRAALEKETAYTRALQQHLLGYPDHSDGLRGHYTPEALMANRNRPRAQTPPASTNTKGHKAGRAIIAHAPAVVREAVGSGLQKVGTAVQWSSETFPRTAVVVGGTLEALHHVTSEIPATYTRRLLRDGLGMNADDAQDIGDVIGFATGLLIPGKTVKIVAETRSVAVASAALSVAARTSKAAVVAFDAKAVTTFENYMARLAQRAPAPANGPFKPMQPKVHNPNAPQTLLSKSQGGPSGLGDAAAGRPIPPSQPTVAVSIDQSTTKLLWTRWGDYPKVTLDGREYAKIGDRLYTHHAVDRMLPKGLGSPAGTVGAGHSCPPSFVEEVIRAGERQVFIENEVQRIRHSLGTITVVTESDIVITVINKS